jgi:hypothetical protein
MSGKRAVIGIGAASEIHHIIIQAATPKTLLAPGDMKSVLTSKLTSRNAKGPAKNPTTLIIGLPSDCSIID